MPNSDEQQQGISKDQLDQLELEQRAASEAAKQQLNLVQAAKDALSALEKNKPDPIVYADQKAELEGKLEKLQAKLVELEAQQASGDSKTNQEEQQLIQSLQQEISNLGNKKSELSQHINEQQAKITTANETIATLEAEIKALAEQEQASQDSAGDLDSRQTELTTKLDDLAARRSQLAKDLQTRQEQLTGLEASLQTESEEATKVRSQISAAEEILQGYQEQIDKLKTEYAQSQDSLGAFDETSQRELLSDITQEYQKLLQEQQQAQQAVTEKTLEHQKLLESKLQQEQEYNKERGLQEIEYVKRRKQLENSLAQAKQDLEEHNRTHRNKLIEFNNIICSRNEEQQELTEQAANHLTSISDEAERRIYMAEQQRRLADLAHQDETMLSEYHSLVQKSKTEGDQLTKILENAEKELAEFRKSEQQKTADQADLEQSREAIFLQTETQLREQIEEYTANLEAVTNRVSQAFAAKKAKIEDRLAEEDQLFKQHEQLRNELKQKREKLEARQATSQQVLTDLHDQLADLTNNSGDSSTSVLPSKADLEKEIAQSETQLRAIDLEISNLKADQAAILSQAGAGTLEELQSKHKDLVQQHGQEVFQRDLAEHSIKEHELEAEQLDTQESRIKRQLQAIQITGQEQEEQASEEQQALEENISHLKTECEQISDQLTSAEADFTQAEKTFLREQADLVKQQTEAQTLAQEQQQLAEQKLERYQRLVKQLLAGGGAEPEAEQEPESRASMKDFVHKIREKQERKEEAEVGKEVAEEQTQTAAEKDDFAKIIEEELNQAIETTQPATEESDAEEELSLVLEDEDETETKSAPAEDETMEEKLSLKQAADLQEHRRRVQQFYEDMKEPEAELAEADIPSEVTKKVEFTSISKKQKKAMEDKREKDQELYEKILSKVEKKSASGGKDVIRESMFDGASDDIAAYKELVERVAKKKMHSKKAIVGGEVSGEELRDRELNNFAAKSALAARAREARLDWEGGSEKKPKAEKDEPTNLASKEDKKKILTPKETESTESAEDSVKQTGKPELKQTDKPDSKQEEESLYFLEEEQPEEKVTKDSVTEATKAEQVKQPEKVASKPTQSEPQKVKPKEEAKVQAKPEKEAKAKPEQATKAQAKPEQETKVKAKPEKDFYPEAPTIQAEPPVKTTERRPSPVELKLEEETKPIHEEFSSTSLDKLAKQSPSDSYDLVYPTTNNYNESEDLQRTRNESADTEFISDSKKAVLTEKSPYSNFILYGVGIFLVLALIWASLAEVDEVTRADGKVIPSSQIQVIQNLEGGILSEINVREGDQVAKDEVLLKIDDTRFSADYKENQKKYYSLLASIARLKAESRGLDTIEFPEEVKREGQDMIASELKLFNQHKEQMEATLKTLKQSYQLALEEMEITKPLVKEGLMSKLELLRLKREVNEVEGNILQEKEDFQSTAQNELTEKQTELAALTEALKAMQDRMVRTTVRSPVRGTVKKINIATRGGVIQPGMDILEIVPAEDTLLIEAKVKPSDIGFIHPEQEALVKVTAYDFSIYGGLDGIVEYISADTIKDEENLNDDESYYKILVRTKKNYLSKDNKKLNIIPGMPVTVDILTGKKSVLDYILKPFLKAKSEALRER